MPSKGCSRSYWRASGCDDKVLSSLSLHVQQHLSPPVLSTRALDPFPSSLTYTCRECGASVALAREMARSSRTCTCATTGTILLACPRATGASPDPTCTRSLPPVCACTLTPTTHAHAHTFPPPYPPPPPFSSYFLPTTHHFYEPAGAARRAGRRGLPRP